MRALRVDTTGEIAVLDLPASPPDARQLRALQDAVGGFIDHIEINKQLSAWVDDEGLIKDVEVNEPASVAVAVLTGMQLSQSLSGPVVFTGGADSEGDLLPLSESAEADVRRALSVHNLHASEE